MRVDEPKVMSFPCGGNPSTLRLLRRNLLRTLVSGASVILDFSGCSSLNAGDIDLLLQCLAHVAGRDTQIAVVTGSRSIRVLLEVTRIASLTPVYDSIEEALAPAPWPGLADAMPVATLQPTFPSQSILQHLR